MSNIAIKGATTGTGTFTIESPATNTDRTLTLPDEAGTIATTNGSLVFAAYKSASPQSLSSGTVTKITYDAEMVDSDSTFASSIFTPNAAGYYQINAGGYAFVSGASITSLDVRLYKNGSLLQLLSLIRSPSGIAGDLVGSGGTLVYSDGDDYFEIYMRVTSSGGTIQASEGQAYNWFNGYFVRAA